MTRLIEQRKSKTCRAVVLRDQECETVAYIIGSFSQPGFTFSFLHWSCVSEGTVRMEPVEDVTLDSFVAGDQNEDIPLTISSYLGEHVYQQLHML